MKLEIDDACKRRRETLAFGSGDLERLQRVDAAAARDADLPSGGAQHRQASVSAVTAIVNDSAVSPVALHFLLVTEPSVGVPRVVDWLLLHVMVPPVANAVASRAWDPPPVFPLQLLTVIVAEMLPESFLQVMLFSAFAFAKAGLPKATVTAETGMVNAATANRTRRMVPPLQQMEPCPSRFRLHFGRDDSSHVPRFPGDRGEAE